MKIWARELKRTESELKECEVELEECELELDQTAHKCAQYQSALLQCQGVLQSKLRGQEHCRKSLLLCQEVLQPTVMPSVNARVPADDGVVTEMMSVEQIVKHMEQEVEQLLPTDDAAIESTSVGTNVSVQATPIVTDLVEPPEACEETHTTVESLVNLGEACDLVEPSEAREEASESARKVAALEYDWQQAAELSEQATLAAAREEKSARKAAGLGMGVPDGVI